MIISYFVLLFITGDYIALTQKEKRAIINAAKTVTL